MADGPRVVVVSLARHGPRFLRVPSWMPWRVLSAAGSLRAAGAEVAFVDGAVPGAPGDLAGAALSARPDTVVLDVPVEAWSVLPRLAERVRRGRPGVRLLAMGRDLADAEREALAWAPELDGVVGREAEPVLAAAAAAASIEDLPGLAVHGRAHGAGEQAVEDLDALPAPAWDLAAMDWYARRTPRVIPCLPLRTATIETSRGCAGGCSYCVEARVHVRRVRCRGEGVLDAWIGFLRSRHGIDGLYLCDEHFTASRSHAERFGEMMLRRGHAAAVRWSAQARSDALDAPLLRLLRRAGCVQLELGIESGSQAALDRLAKGVVVERHTEAVRRCREAGVRTLAYVMTGLPGETAAELDATAAWLRSARPDIVRAVPFIAFPGSPASRALEAEGRLPPAFWRRAPAAGGLAGFNVSAMSDEDLAAKRRDLFLRHALPRFARDYLRHNAPWRAASHLRLRALPAWLAGRLRSAS